MNRNNKTAPKTAKIWQRHTLAQACFMVAAGLSTTAMAQVYTPGAAFNSINGTLDPVAQSDGNFWSTGYNQQIQLDQYGAAPVSSNLPLNTYTSTESGAGVMPVNISNNSLLAYTYGNQNTSGGLSLAGLARVSENNDGQLNLNLQIFSGLVVDDEGASFTKNSLLANAEDTGPFILQTGKSAAALTLSGNTIGATLAINTVDTSISGATPFAYASTTQGSSQVTFGDNNSSGTPLAGASAPNSTRGTTGSVNLSNLQSTFNADGTAQVDNGSAKITVAQTSGALSSNINLNSNTIAASNTSNAAINTVQASASSMAFTGSVSVTNIQATKVDETVTANQLANVADGNIQADLRDASGGETVLTGTLNVNGNTVTAKALGNTAGARNSLGNIAAGNVILFEGNADITGSTAPTSAVAHSSSISSTVAEGYADFLINSVQRNSGNVFTSSIDPSVISSKADILNAGSINQSGNTQAATASANLAGNLISAGPSASIGNIVANAAILNTQINIGVEAVASVKNSSQTVTVGIAGSEDTITGTVNLNNNSITATAEGNAAASTLSLKASNLTVGSNGSSQVILRPTASGTDAVASSGLSTSVLSVQKNDGLTLTSNNEGNSVSVGFNDQGEDTTSLAITGSQVNLNGNALLSTATANAASNALTLSATNAAGLNAGLGNSQYITGSSLITSNAGFDTALSVGITAANVSSSALSLNTNTQSASAKGNSATNTMSVTASSASGLTVGEDSGMFLNVPASLANFANGGDANVNADFALGNAQMDNGSVIKGLLVGSSKITTGEISAASTVSANANSLTASATVNTASNSIGLSIGNMTGMTAGLSSTQSAANSVATASATGEVSLNTGAVAGSSSLTLNTNTISASASANSVSNSLSLVATTASGRDLAIGEDSANTALSSGSVSSGASVTADLALSNRQQITATDSSYSATTIAGIKALTGAGGVTDSSLTVNSNNTLASASGNNASNSIDLSVTNLTKPNTGLTSVQSMDTASFTASVTDAVGTVGTGIITAAADNAQLAVNNNTLRASALGNVVTNSVALAGTNATGSSSNFSSPVVSSAMDGSGVSVPASVALVNAQSSNGNGMSAVVGASEGGSSKITLTATAVSNAATLSATGNTLATQVYNNSANNSIALNVTNLNGMTAGLASGQSVTAALSEGDYTAISATTYGQVAVTGTTVAGASALSASNNSLTALLYGNTASNSLSVSATNASGQNAAGGTTSNAFNLTSAADFAVLSEQRLMNSVMTATTEGTVQLTATTVAGSALSLNDNTVSAQGTANNANNTLSLATANLTAARAGLVNSQYLESADGITARVENAGTTLTATTVSASQLSVTDNLLKASAMGNMANNQFSVSGTNVTAGSVNLDSSAAATNGTNVTSGLALSSLQENQADTRAINGTDADNRTTVGLTATAVSSASSLTLSDNTVSSQAYANYITNGMGLTVSNLNGITAGLANKQIQDRASETTVATTFGAVTATMTEVGGGSTAAVNNNTISAVSGPNYASNSLLVTATQITGRDAISPSVQSSGDATATADIGLANYQASYGDGDFARASVTGNVQLNGGNLTGSTMSLNANNVTATVNTNNAFNTLLVNTTNLTTASTGLASSQAILDANINAETAGRVYSSLGTLDAGNLTVNNNLVKATAVGNSVNNAMGLLATNASGADLAVTAVASINTGEGDFAKSFSDVGLSNSQTLYGSSIQALTGAMAGTAAVVGQTLDAITNGSVVALDGNALSSVAYGNSASNLNSLSVGTLNGVTAGSANMQISDGSEVIAKTNGEVSRGVLAINGSNVTVNSNLIASLAVNNYASNTLQVVSSSMTGREKASELSVSSESLTSDLALINAQKMLFTSPVTAWTNSYIGLNTDGEALTNSNLSMNSNAVTAYASGNQATNALSLAATNQTATTSGLLSIQEINSTSTVYATTTGAVSVDLDNVVNSNLNLNSNLVKSTALGNLANNQLVLSGTNAANSSSLSGFAINNGVVKADVAMNNSQYVSGGSDVIATTQEFADGSTPYSLGVYVADVNTGSAVSVNTNTVASLAYVNNASNSLSVGVTNLGATNAALNNQQTVGSANASAITKGAVLLEAASVDTASLSVNNNTISATAQSNSATNTLTVSATEATGRALAGRQLLTFSSGLAIKADYALGNQQSNASSTSADNNSEVSLYSGGFNVDSSTLSQNGNSITAYASSNAATNTLNLAVTRLSQASAGVASLQIGSGANVSSSVTGVVSMTADTLNDPEFTPTASTLSVNNNTIKATALGNTGTNSLSLTGTTFTSTGTGDIYTNVNAGVVTSSADFGVSNNQTQTGTVSATGIARVSISTGSANDTSLNLTGNSIKTIAQANSASNDLTLTAGQQNGISAAVSSYQSNTANVTASTSPNMGGVFNITTTDDVANSSISVTGNTASASAGKNEAFNALTVSGATVTGRGNSVTDSVVGTVNVSGADFAVMNAQSASGNATASVNAGTSGMTNIGAFDGATVTVSGNSILATANANNAGNTLTLAATNTLEASGVVNNVQTLAANAEVSASVATGSALSVETGSGNGSAAIAVTGNTVKATASANMATNVLNASATNGIDTAGALTNPASFTATPTFAVLNSQHTGSGSTVSATITNFSMGGAQLNGALNGGSAVISGNLVQAAAYGNSASNAIQVSVLPAGLNTASASITSVQYNLASVSSTVTGASVQGNVVNSTGNAGVNISGNSIVAMAVGNRAVNTITGR